VKVRKRRTPREVSIESDGEDMYVVADGVRVARRGRPGTLQAGTWIMLEPGWTVTGINPGPIEISHETPIVH
jgi:hypothetical protein